MDFDAAGAELQDKVHELKRLFDVTSEDLKYKWESWAMKQSEEPTLNETTLAQFQEHLYNEATRPAKKPKLTTPRTIRTIPDRTPLSPKTHHKAVPQIHSDIPSSPAFNVYKTHTNAGSAIVEYGNCDCTPGETIIELSGNAEEYRSMHVKISESTQVIDDQIEDFLELLQKAHDIFKSDICNPAVPTQQDSWAVGRILSNGRLGPETTSLQTCRRLGAGTHVPLDLEQLKEFSFFPGQIVALKGNNPSGEKFVARELYSLPDPIVEGENDDSTVIIAAGPFSTKDNLDYTPLVDLVETINRSKPSAAILIGPFVEPLHPLVLSGDVGTAESIADVFKQRVSPLLAQIQVPIILVPGLQDDVGGHIPFPQPALAKAELEIPLEYHCTGNPTTFSINGTQFAVTSADPVQDIMRSKYEKGSFNLSKAFQHLLDQRSLYPVFPSPRPTVVSLDVPHVDRVRLERIPQVLIVSSTTAPLATSVHGVLCINPGFLSKQTAAGTYAKVSVAKGSGSVATRSEVKIIGI